MTGKELLDDLERIVADCEPPAHQFPLAVAVCATSMRLTDQRASDALELVFQDPAFSQKAIEKMQWLTMTVWDKSGDRNWAFFGDVRPDLVKACYDRLEKEKWLQLQAQLLASVLQEFVACWAEDATHYGNSDILYRAAYHMLFIPEMAKGGVAAMKSLMKSHTMPGDLESFAGALMAIADEVRYCRQEPDPIIEELLQEAELISSSQQDR